VIVLNSLLKAGACSMQFSFAQLLLTEAEFKPEENLDAKIAIHPCNLNEIKPRNSLPNVRRGGKGWTVR
jgi:hypothetical protein